MAVLNPTKEQFDSLTSEGMTLVDFWAAWCGPCRAQAPIVEQLEECGVKLVKIDVDQADELPAKFGITSIPTLLLYKNGALIAKYIGLTPLDTLKQAFGI